MKTFEIRTYDVHGHLFQVLTIQRATKVEVRKYLNQVRMGQIARAEAWHEGREVWHVPRKRGGYRANAGRPVGPEGRKVSRWFTLPRKVLLMLKEQENESQFVADAIKEKYARDHKE